MKSCRKADLTDPLADPGFHVTKWLLVWSAFVSSSYLLLQVDKVN